MSLVSVSARVGRDVSTFAEMLRHWSESRVLVYARSVKWCSSAVHASMSCAVCVHVMSFGCPFEWGCVGGRWRSGLR
eukprot:7322861-Pyramimonas_sp.AAC.1